MATPDTAQGQQAALQDIVCLYRFNSMEAGEVETAIASEYTTDKKLIAPDQ